MVRAKLKDVFAGRRLDNIVVEVRRGAQGPVKTAGLIAGYAKWLSRGKQSGVEAFEISGFLVVH